MNEFIFKKKIKIDWTPKKELSFVCPSLKFCFETSRVHLARSIYFSCFVAAIAAQVATKNTPVTTDLRWLFVLSLSATLFFSAVFFNHLRLNFVTCRRIFLVI